MHIWLYTIISVILVSLVSLIGVFTLALKPQRLQKITLFLVSFAAGALFGDTFIHLLPASFDKSGKNLSVPLLIILGIVFFFILEKFLRWRHCHAQPCEAHLRPVVAMNLIGDAVHNFLDGVMIGASFLVNPTIGITTALAVILHEIPQEIGDFGILLHGGLSVKKALFFNFLCALTAIAGALISLIIGAYVQNYTLFLLPIIAGGFLYIAGSDLIPELQHELKLSTSCWQLFLMLLGVGVMALLVLFE
jgi:zinc and cadmium transporter